MTRLRRWQRALVFVWVALALGAMYARGRRTEIDQNVTSRLRYHAIPVAMSVLYHGRQHDYTGYRSLALGFQAPDDPIESRLAWAVTYTPPDGDAPHYWAADDRGMADYVIGAFALFGPRVTSLYLFYFVMLGSSVLLFLLDIGWHPVASALLMFALAAMYTCFSVIPLGNLTVAVFESGALYEPRLIELLSFVATVHLGVTSFIDDLWTRRRVALVAAQAAFLAACYHMRSSVGWEVAFVLIAGVALSARRMWSARRLAVSSAQRTNAFRPLWPVACVAAAFVLLTAYRHHAYNPRYFQDMGARTIWHNALMGLGSNPYLNGRYNVRIDDRAIVNSVTSYLRETHDPRVTAEWNADSILSSLGGASVFNWFVYEEAARDFYWHIWRADTRRVLHCYLIDKPTEEIAVVVKAWQTDPTGVRDRSGLYFRPLAVPNLIMILPAFVLVWTSGATFRPSLVGALVLLACSAVPGLMFYPVVHTMIGAFAALALALYLTLATGLAAVSRVVQSAGNPMDNVRTATSSRGMCLQRTVGATSAICREASA